MIKYAMKMWEKNNGLLRTALENDDELLDKRYADLVRYIVEYVLNKNAEIKYNADEITEMCDGDYQGTLTYMIPQEAYQPGEHQRLITFVNYGSCSGCDAWEHIKDYRDGKATEEQINEIMDLCLHITENMEAPFNTGWRHREDFDPC